MLITQKFKIDRDVRQVYAMSPLLFSVYMGEIMKWKWGYREWERDLTRKAEK